MKRMTAVILIVPLLLGSSGVCFGSDWDVAGKVLTGIEGLRILTRGNVDIIGNIAGIENKERNVVRRAYECKEACRRRWVPHFAWKKKWIPAHNEYVQGLGVVFVKGRYIKYKVRNGGHWVYDCPKRIGND